MELIDIPTEQSTAITDLVLGVMAIVAAAYLNTFSHINRWKISLWIWVFGLMSVASILGAIAHGFKLSSSTQLFLWHPLYLSLGLLVGIFLVAAMNDFWGEGIARRALPVMVVIGIVFFSTTIFLSDNFLVFIFYQAAIMIIALGIYILLAYKRQLEGAWFMASGIFVSILAAVVQANNLISFDFVWLFDHNGVYHLIQMVALVLLVAGLRKKRELGSMGSDSIDTEWK